MRRPRLETLIRGSSRVNYSPIRTLCQGAAQAPYARAQRRERGRTRRKIQDPPHMGDWTKFGRGWFEKLSVLQSCKMCFPTCTPYGEQDLLRSGNWRNSEVSNEQVEVVSPDSVRGHVVQYCPLLFFGDSSQ
jgi:hypothetical protein